MFILKILLYIFLGCTVLYLLVPKGSFLYEILRLPVWVSRLLRFPVGNYIETKHPFGKHFRQYLLFYQPLSKTTPHQHVVVYIHGGGWQFGRPEMFRPNAQALVDQGYFVFMPSHRRIPFFNCEHMREDVALCIAKVLEIMQEHGLGDKKIILGGMSSGGNLAGLLSFDASVLKTVGLSPNLFSAIFLLGAPLNLGGMWRSPPLWMLAGKRSGNLFPKSNPLFHLNELVEVPVLLLHGTKDGLVEYESVQVFYEKLKSIHTGRIEFVSLPGGIHTDAASWCFPGHPSRKILLDWLQKQER